MSETRTYSATIEAEATEASRLSVIASDWARILEGNRHVAAASPSLHAESAGPIDPVEGTAAFSGKAFVILKGMPGGEWPDYVPILLSEALGIAVRRYRAANGAAWAEHGPIVLLDD